MSCCSKHCEPVLNLPRSRARQTWIEFQSPPRECWEEEGLWGSVRMHIERSVANTSCRKELQEDLLKYRQKKILEAAQRRTSLKKCCRDLREYNISLAALLSEDGTRMSSRGEMEIITERLYSNIFPPLKASPNESVVVRISGGVFVYGIVDYGEKGDSINFFLIAVKNGPEDMA
ncbi:hypothetical protein RB195_001261 [Necator americanus]|uniref:Uncharacterized protein n=1 Tax=Necator americanus TaxID=51031 RepID=A0ABR1DES3_NECAM